MADRRSEDVDTLASQVNQKHKNTYITQLLDRFIAEVTRLVDDEDWKRFDDWVARLVLWGNDGKQTYVCELKEGRLGLSESEGPFVATITMSVDTFVDLVEAALFGKAGSASERNYAARHIAFEGKRWVFDSERVRNIFRRLGSATGTRNKAG
ncbi:MAG: hypothetical protein ACE5JL_11230 [Dehalococcoidia bacterium]